MRKATVLVALAVFGLTAFYVSRTDALFPGSLHYTRAGKSTWYEAGFKHYTNVDIPEACAGCHAATLANGTPVDPATYQPSCNDCHVVIGDSPANAVCLGCHSRQGAEISLSASPNPEIAERFRDVHREAGMACVDCHTSAEVHGDGGTYASMFEATHLNTTCDDCHTGDSPVGPVPPSSVQEHMMHLDDIECAACHASTVVSCVNCHFESELDHKKRYYGGPPMNGFMLLVNNLQSGKVGPASFQSLTWNDKEPGNETTFFGMGPFGPHTTKAEGRKCSACHDNANVRTYNAEGVIPFIKWSSDDSQLHMVAPGVIPVPEDYVTALGMDYVRFLGQTTDPVQNPKNPAEWAFMRSGTDDAHMLYAEPLSAAQMAILSTNMSVGVEDPGEVPEGFRLEQNYPNPFNPATTISFGIGREMNVSLAVYDLTGSLVESIFENRRLARGTYAKRFDASGLASGIYLYRLQAAGFVITRAMTVVK
jgi:hypothetical protein